MAFNSATKLINKTLPASEVEVGKTITQGIKNGVNASDGFVGRFQSRVGQLFEEASQLVPKNTLVSLESTLTKLKDLVAPH